MRHTNKRAETSPRGNLSAGLETGNFLEFAARRLLSARTPRAAHPKGTAMRRFELRRQRRACFGHSAAAALLMLSAVGVAGCQLEPPAVLNPGSLEYQRARANRYDPFPDPQAGPSDAGMRPREFANPPPEPSRSRWQKAPPP